ncbi:MAG TPA: ATP-binding protein [Planctomycetota bacterium]|nr:ATP-binding protein [Planctomycetota bacterium]
MKRSVARIALKLDTDVVAARRRAREVAWMLGCDAQQQIRIAAAASELARAAVQRGGGKLDVAVELGEPVKLHLDVEDRGPVVRDVSALLSGREGDSLLVAALRSAGRVVDELAADARPEGGLRVHAATRLPGVTPLAVHELATRTEELGRRGSGSVLDEAHRQHQEVLALLEDARARQSEIERLSRELDETNRGVLALHSQLYDAAAALERVSALKSEFLSSLSHEIRTPINSIANLSALLLARTDGELTTEQERQLAYIQRSAHSLVQLVSDHLDMAKMEAGKLELRVTRFTASDLFTSLRGMFRPLVVGGVVELVFDDVSRLPTLQTDEGKVSQVLRNLIANALKFTERGSVRVGAEVDDESACFHVADTGIGIAPENQARIFEPFEQVESHVQRRVSGTGLGLPLSRKLASLLGGRITLKSEAGAGSTFSFSIPMCRGDSSPAAKVAGSA